MTDTLWQPFTHADLDAVIELVGIAYREAQFSGEHPGNILHHLSNGMRGQNTESALRVYHQSGGLRAVLLFEDLDEYVFSVTVHPDLWQTPLERTLHLAGEQQLLQLAPEPSQAEGDNPPAWVHAAWDGNQRQMDFLQSLGYTLDPQPFILQSLRDLTDIPPAQLLDGYTIRNTTEADVEQLCAVHSSAFDSDWTPEEYLAVMRTPGFDPSRERVVVAPDGRFAAFCVWWPDAVSKVAQFEPVGCHADFQRRGLTRALMYDTMHLMRAAGMTHVMVGHEPAEENPASAALYAALGFQRRHGLFDAKKPITK